MSIAGSEEVNKLDSIREADSCLEDDIHYARIKGPRGIVEQASEQLYISTHSPPPSEGQLRHVVFNVPSDLERMYSSTVWITESVTQSAID